MKLSEGAITKTLWSKYGVGQWACANIYHYAFESDLLILRNSGTVVEYEVKLSVQDWNAGLKKRQFINKYNSNRRKNQTLFTEKPMSRHEYLTADLGANMFYYVAPQEVLEKVEIPPWAGVIEAYTNTHADSCGIMLVKKASSLHKDTPAADLKEKIMISAYYKYWKHFSVKDINPK